MTGGNGETVNRGNGAPLDFELRTSNCELGNVQTVGGSRSEVRGARPEVQSPRAEGRSEFRIMGDVGSKAHFRLVRGRPSLTERTDATRTANGDQGEISIMWDVGSETTFAHKGGRSAPEKLTRICGVRS